MQVTVFGASGKVGQLVVGQLVASGNTVVAFIHKSNPFEGMDGVNVVRGTLDDSSVVSRAITGSAAVISTLGSWGSPNKDIVSTGTKAIIDAMTNRKVSRLITLTGASAFYTLDIPSMQARLTRNFLKMIAPDILADGEKHLKLLEHSDLEWTCVRSPAMTSMNSDSYRLSDKLPSVLAFIPRKAVARSLVDQITDKEFLRKAPVIYRG